MSLPSRFGAEGDGRPQVFWADGERVLWRSWRKANDGKLSAVLAVVPASKHPSPSCLDRMAHEYGLKDVLDGAWVVRPLALERETGTSTLVLEDPDGEPLERLLGPPMAVGSFLPLAVGIAGALGKLHVRGLVHRDLKPSHVLVNCADGQVRLTGFGIASRLPRQRQAPDPPEVIAGTLAYMAPEQTGRMNRSIDSRSDLYALGVALYQMLTGVLPFTASDPIEWIHCHIARLPVPPAERLPGSPAALSDIIMKLLAKTAEERYQTAPGLEHDLRRCLTQWEAQSRIDAFPLGENDTPDRLLIAEKLYGRAREVDVLLAAFDRVLKSGAAELVLVSGYSGVGKSVVVHELHKVLVPPHGLFASGKFDQYKRDIPYATLVQAFQGLVRPLLGKSEAELSRWCETLREALGPNGQLMVNLIPELKFVIGEQPQVPELPPQDAQRRFQLVFRRFIGVFARPEHPLALFLDDLQWLDAATLDIVEDLLIQPDVQYLLLIGAYRDNEVHAVHPLMRKLDVIKNAGGKIANIKLAPLAQEHLSKLIADSVRCEPSHAAPLTQLVHDKTAGNPFFVIQFLRALAEEGLLAFDHSVSGWTWDLERIRAKSYTDNVVDLLVGKLTRLTAETQRALQVLACLGNVAETTILSIVLGIAAEDVEAVLWEAERQELVERLDGSHRFVHDRVQEAAYSLIPQASREADHLLIGRLLAARTPPEQLEEVIFEIVNQLNRGAALITAREEREQLAEFNLMAGKRAKAATAHASALTYVIAGSTLLSEDCWERRRELIFELELNRAECEFLTGALAAAEQRLTALSARATNTVERSCVACQRMDLYVTLAQSSRAVAVGLDYLHHIGVDWSPHPSDEEAREVYDRIWAQLGNRTIEELVDLPLMSDRASLATLDILTGLASPAYHTDANLLALLACRAVSLSIDQGNCDASCAAYARLGRIAGARFGDYQAAYRFGQLGCELVERHGLKRFQATTYLTFGHRILPWTRHVRLGRDLVRRAFEAANNTGDFTQASYACDVMIANFLIAGDPLVDVQREAEHGLAYAQKARFGLVIDIITTQLGLVRTLRGLTPTFGSFQSNGFDELEMERRLSSNSDLAIAEYWYWIRKLQAHFLAGDCASAVDASSRAQRALSASALPLDTSEYHFYSALSLSTLCDFLEAEQQVPYLGSLATHHRQLEIWAANCPENFENRAALVAAEIARLEGRDRKAMDLYEQAARSAGANGFVHNEALANELAARFYASRGFERFAHICLQDARYGYVRWGANGKVRQLDQLYPRLEPELVSKPASTIGAPIEHLDLGTVIKVAQAVSTEIVLEKLLNTVMHTAIEQAGAQRGLLLAPRGTEQRIAAEATTPGDTVKVLLRDEPVNGALPESILHHVVRTREAVVLDDAAAENPFAGDTYLQQHHPRSILCLPLINQSKLIGVLYLENNLAPHVFTAARLAVLKLLASQAAISLENTRLYRDVVEREAKIRRLVDANIIGIFLWEAEGQIIEANDAFLEMLGRDREDLVGGRLRWPDLTPPEWRERHEQVWTPEIKMTGTVQPYEKEYFRKDGSRVPVLVGAAGFDETANQGVSFVLDLTERKRAEAEVRESEARYRQLQMQLAHANRLATMGQLAASIAHEVNQPIAATMTNAQAALRWLDAQPPNLEETRQAVARIVKNSTRAGDVIGGIRALIVDKVPTRTDRLDINDTILDVIALIRGELSSNAVSLHTQFAQGLPLIHGDRVQLQQVMLNLIVNAIEAMSSTGEGARELWIGTEIDAANHALVAVRDSGPGLDPTSLEHLFDAFYTTKSSGMGMGLSICRSIIEAHGGRLWAEPNEPRGAIFRFTVPAHQ